ncbi:MAG: M20/M25/M40 family metallo-hydrolase [Betaproteobacteria bacterium]|nr:M20/M25/M40 family metallo-hydrolase [Betaproteobacteria bacterium]
MASVDALRLTQDLLRFNTINPPGAEEPCARHLGAILESAGFRVTYHRLAADRANLVATIGGQDDVAPIVFTGHIDVVPLGAAVWSRDPFAGETDAGRLYGRGSSDMKSGVAAFVAAAVELAPHLARSPGVSIVITAGEETGCLGAFQLVATPGALGRAGAIVVAEPTGNFPYVGHKGAFWLNAITRGVTAHGSMPEKGVNAVYKAARAVTCLEHFHFRTEPHPLMGQGTLNVGTFSGGLNINSVPDRAVIGIDMRTVPTQTHAGIRDALAAELGADVDLETLLDVESVYTEPENEWVQSVFDVMHPHLGARPDAKTATYFTDAAALKPAYGHPPTIILGPGEPQMAHQTDEYCIAERVTESTAAFVEIMRRWCRA